MEGIRLNQTVNNHDIVIPFDTVRLLNHQEVDIIILPKKTSTALNSQKSTLAAVFERNKNVTPFQEINDPIAWQENLRNEW